MKGALVRQTNRMLLAGDGGLCARDLIGEVAWEREVDDDRVRVNNTNPGRAAYLSERLQHPNRAKHVNRCSEENLGNWAS